jgi:Galactose oxidase, central domain
MLITLRVDDSRCNENGIWIALQASGPLALRAQRQGVLTQISDSFGRHEDCLGSPMRTYTPLRFGRLCLPLALPLALASLVHVAACSDDVSSGPELRDADSAEVGLGSDSGALPSDAGPSDAQGLDASKRDAAALVINPKGLPTGPIDALIAGMAVGEWKALPNTAMTDVCPKASDGKTGTYQCAAVVGAWGSAALDTARDRILVFGGGHADSALNNVFEFDLASMKWTRVTEGPQSFVHKPGAPSIGDYPPHIVDTFYEPCGYYPTGVFPIPESWRGTSAADPVFARLFIKPELCELPEIQARLDTQQPRSAHTYGNIAYAPNLDALCLTGLAATFVSGQALSQEVACFDLSTRQWQRRGRNPFIAYNRAAVDARGDVWYQGSYALAEYNQGARVFEKKFENQVYSLTAGAAEIDRKRDQFYSYSPATNALHVQSLRTGLVEPMLTGPSAAIAESPGFVYADHQDAFYLWNTGRELWKFDPASKSWASAPSTGDDPGARTSTGTFGRLRYSPNRKVLVLLNAIKSNVLVYKLAP